MKLNSQQCRALRLVAIHRLLFCEAAQSLLGLPSKSDAFELLDADPTLGDHPALLAEVDTLLADDETDFLLKS